MKQAYRGSCHCGAITFAAAFDIAAGTGKCNCRLCWKQRMWKTDRIPVADFVLRAEPGRLGGYPGRHQGTHHFCTGCGISTHTHVLRAETGEEYVLVQVAAFDDLPVEDLLAAPLRIVDGRHDAWTRPPGETRHL